MQKSTAVSSAAPGRAVSHADASDPARMRKRARSARAADRAGEEAPFASASSVAKRAAEGGVGVRMEDCLLHGCHPQGLAIRLAPRPLCHVVWAVGQAFHGRPCPLKPGQRRVCLEPHCDSEGQSLVRSPRQRCVGEGCRQQARSCRDVFAQVSQAHAGAGAAPAPFADP